MCTHESLRGVPALRGGGLRRGVPPRGVSPPDILLSMPSNSGSIGICGGASGLGLSERWVQPRPQTAQHPEHPVTTDDTASQYSIATNSQQKALFHSK